MNREIKSIFKRVRESMPWRSMLMLALALMALSAVAGGCTSDRYHGDITPNAEGGVTFHPDPSANNSPPANPSPDLPPPTITQTPPVNPAPTAPPVVTPGISTSVEQAPDLAVQNKMLMQQVSDLQMQVRDLQEQVAALRRQGSPQNSQMPATRK